MKTLRIPSVPRVVATPGRRTLIAAALSAVLSAPALAASPVVISQVYGGGGNSGATFKNDFIELFNRGDAAVDITGWSVQYASAAGSNWAVSKVTGNVTLQPGQYFLLQQSAGSGGSESLPTPDTLGSLAMGGSAGKVALVNNSTALSGAAPSKKPAL